METKILILLLLAFNIAKSQTYDLPLIKSQINDNSIIEKVSQFNVYQIDVSKIELLDEFYLNMEFENSISWNIHLEKNNLRAKNFQSYIISNQGKVKIDNEIRTYKGYLNNNPADDVRLTIYQNSIEGYIRSGDSVFYIFPLERMSKIKNSNKILLCNANDMVQNVNEEDYIIKSIEQQLTTLKSENPDIVTKLARIAIEADWEFYLDYSSGSQAYIENVVNATEGLYISVFNISFEIVFIEVYGFINDPFTVEPFDKTNGSAVLSEFKTHFENEYNTENIDVAFLFTGKPLTDLWGNSYTPGSYSVVGDQSYITKTFAHEFGHIFNGRHEYANECGVVNSASLMCTGEVKNPFYFSAGNINQITNNTDVRLISFSGPQMVCASNFYTIGNMPSGATIEWSNSSNITQISAQGSNPCEFSTNGSGTGTIGATINIGSTEEITLPSRSVYVNEVPVIISGPPTQHCGSGIPYFLDEFSVEYGDSFYWDSNFLTITDRYSSMCIAGSYQNGSGYLSCTVTTCGVPKTTYFNVTVICLHLRITPNPSSGETIISVEQSDFEETTLDSAFSELAFDENTEWNIEVYDTGQNLKLQKQKLKGKSTKVQTASWKEGVYIVRVKYKGNVLTGRLIVGK